jgi:hypothetical protein
MIATTLKIVLHGLLALVPNNEPGGTHQMTVLMLDGSHSHGIQCMGAHNPKLLVRADNAKCVQAGCSPAGGICTCEQALARKELWLEIEPQSDPPRRELPKDPPRAIPRDRKEAAELGYVANLARPPFNLSLNQQYLLASPPPNLFARLQFPFDTITACGLARRFDGGEAYVHAMGFRLLGNMWEEGEMSQAMAQMVIADVTIPDAGAAGQNVILHLKNLDGEGEVMIPLLPSGPHLYLIDFSNDTTPLPVGHPCDDGIARHFALFYELAQSPPPLEERLIPHVRLTQSKCADALDLQACEIPTFHLLDRPICPMAIFNP